MQAYTKRALSVLLFIVLMALLWQLYQLYLHNKELRESFSALNNRVETFNEENLVLQADLEYFSEPENLEKEIRSRFNYKKPGENLIIIVPPKNDN